MDTDCTHVWPVPHPDAGGFNSGYPGSGPQDFARALTRLSTNVFEGATTSRATTSCDDVKHFGGHRDYTFSITRRDVDTGGR
jgi:hypothetical protein